MRRVVATGRIVKRNGIKVEWFLDRVDLDWYRQEVSKES